MLHRILESLKSRELEVSVSMFSNPRVVHRVLHECEWVGNIRSGLISGEITEEMIRQFCSGLLRHLRSGQRFEFEIALAALVVGLETRVTPFADELIRDLARLELPELPLAIRIARVVREKRLLLPTNQSKLFHWSNQEARQSEWRTAPAPIRVRVGDVTASIPLEAI